MNIEYEIIRSKRKTLAIQLYPDGKIVVRAPKLMPKYKIKTFIESKKPWIIDKLEKQRCKNQELEGLPVITQEKIEELKLVARQYLPERVQYFASIMGVEYNRIAIRCQSTRWGSCSSKKNLNFNCLLMLTPSEVIDYVVVHELCHLKQMNHSKAFWDEVQSVLPNYKQSYDWIKRNGSAIINRVEK